MRAFFRSAIAAVFRAPIIGLIMGDPMLLRMFCLPP